MGRLRANSAFLRGFMARLRANSAFLRGFSGIVRAFTAEVGRFMPLSEPFRAISEPFRNFSEDLRNFLVKILIYKKKSEAKFYNFHLKVLFPFQESKPQTCQIAQNVAAITTSSISEPFWAILREFTADIHLRREKSWI